MVLVIDDTNISQFNDVMEKVYRFRHALFVERLKWEECRKIDNREIDQFDGVGCIHFVRLDAGSVSAYSRLLPTTKPNLLNTIYPHLVQRAPSPNGPKIYEWTRCGTLPSRREGRTGIIDPATAEIFTAVADTAVDRGMEGLLAQTHPILVARLMSCGWDVQPLGLPTKYLGHSVIPVYARLTPQTAIVSRRFFGLDQSAVVSTIPRPKAWYGVDERLRA